MATASQIKATNNNVDGYSTIRIYKEDSSYRHTLTYTFGTLSGTIANKTPVSSLNWHFPDEFESELGSNSKMYATITCVTYDGTTEVGSTTCRISIWARSNGDEGSDVTTISPTVYDSNSATVALTGSSSRLVKYMSNATYSINATPKDGTTIIGYEATCGSQNSNGASGTFTGVDDGVFTFEATDSEGTTVSSTTALEMIDYVKLTCVLTAGNPNASGQLVFHVGGSYFNDSFGSVSNTLTLKYRYKAEDGSFGSWVSMTPTVSGYSYEASATLSGLDVETQYIFEIQATDSLMTATNADGFVSSVPLFNWGQSNGIGYFNHNTDIYFGEQGSANNAIYGNYNGSHVGNVQVINSSGNCLIGKGNYDRGAGDTIIYSGDDTSFYVNGYSGVAVNIDSSGTSVNNGMSVSNGLTAYGGASLNGGTTISSGATITGGADVSGGLDVSGTLNANSTLNANAGLSVSGTAWVEGGVRAYNYTINGYELPYVQSGYVTLKTTASSTVSASVTFPKSYTASPDVALGVYTTVPSYTSAGFSGISRSGFTIYLNRTNAATTYVYWVAVGSI